MEKQISRIDFAVQPEDIDGNTHMNNAAYAVHFEQGRNDLFESCGLDPLSLEPRGITLYMRKANYTYRNPVKEKDELTIETSFEGIRHSKFIETSQRMFCGEKLVATSRAIYVFVELKTEKSVSPPVELVEKLSM
jgi:YbgC/YbaW family acyl-CoA thioester hydrolase